jgi:PhnB protein
MHARLVVDHQMLMASDSLPGQHTRPQGSTLPCRWTSLRRWGIFKSLAESGRVTVPMSPAFWAIRFGRCADRFGTPWMVNCPQTD